jgi:hypothetical protein
VVLTHVQRIRGGLLFKAQRLFHHSSLGLRAMQKRRSTTACIPRSGRPRHLSKARAYIRARARVGTTAFANNFFIQMCSGSEESSYSRRIDVFDSERYACEQCRREEVPRRAFRVEDVHVVCRGPGHVSVHGYGVCGEAWCRVQG